MSYFVHSNSNISHTLLIFPLQNTVVQPGEIVPIVLFATDQVGNYREAVWSLEAPAQETVSI